MKSYTVRHTIERTYHDVHDKAYSDVSSRAMKFESEAASRAEYDEQCARASRDISYAKSHFQRHDISHYISLIEDNLDTADHLLLEKYADFYEPDTWEKEYYMTKEVQDDRAQV